MASERSLRLAREEHEGDDLGPYCRRDAQHGMIEPCPVCLAVARLLDREREQLVAQMADWIATREDAEDCTCAAGDYPCWYHLTREQRAEVRIESLHSWLDSPPPDPD